MPKRKHISPVPLTVPWPNGTQEAYNNWQSAEENERIAEENAINQVAPVAGSAARSPHTHHRGRRTGPLKTERKRAKAAFMRIVGACDDCRQKRVECEGYYDLGELDENYRETRRRADLKGIHSNPAIQAPFPNPSPQDNQLGGDIDLPQPIFPDAAPNSALEAFELLYDVSNRANTLSAVPHVDTGYQQWDAITAQNHEPVPHAVLDAVSPFALGDLPSPGASEALIGTTLAPLTSSGTRYIAIGKEYLPNYGLWECQSNQSTWAEQNEGDNESCSHLVSSVDDLESHYHLEHAPLDLLEGAFSQYQDGTFVQYLIWKCGSCQGEGDWAGPCRRCSAPTNKWLYWILNLTSPSGQHDQWGNSRGDGDGAGSGADYDGTGVSGSSYYSSHQPGAGSNNSGIWSQGYFHHHGYTYSYTSAGSHSVCSDSRSYVRLVSALDDQVGKQRHGRKCSTLCTELATNQTLSSLCSRLVRNLRGLKGARRDDCGDRKRHHDTFKEWPFKRQHNLSLVFAALSISSDDSLTKVSPMTISTRKSGGLNDGVTLSVMAKVNVPLLPVLDIMNRRTSVPGSAVLGSLPGSERRYVELE